VRFKFFRYGLHPHGKANCLFYHSKTSYLKVIGASARHADLDYNPLSLKMQSPDPSRRGPRRPWPMAVNLKSPQEIEKMRLAGRLASEVLDFIAPHVRPGVTTGELDRLCHEYISEVQNATPAPLNYAPPGYQPFPKSICTSVNHVVCHGVPGERKLRAGDILNIDITVIKDGYHGDTSRMFYIGQPSIQARRLCEATYECLWRGIEMVRPAAYLGDIGHAIQSLAERHGFSVVREFCGHGIGKKFHEEPQVLHYGRPGTGLKLETGMTFTIEPMINAGRPDVRQLADGWTVVTKDHSLSAQWEHTVLVTEAGHEVLTLSAGAPPLPKSGSWQHG
jgi:methionyl aminopeptidase